MPDDHIRRPDFDAIVTGWGGDGLEDLIARAGLLAEYWKEHMPLTAAELKIAKAMRKRLTELGGFVPMDFN